MDRKLLSRYVIREALGLVMLGVALFWPAGRLDWWPGWALLGVTAAWVVATLVVIVRLHPALLAERLGPRKGSKPWDTAILGLLGVTQLARYVIAGFDQRYHWTGSMPLAMQIGALMLCLLGYAVFIWATAANAYFAQVVRIQAERGHTVATGGPYHYVRHPAYLGAIAVELGVPIALSSWPALAISAVNVILLLLRTALEDRTLMAELAGYADYAGRVRFRLVPGIW